jgi:CRISPR-associated protein Csb2
VSAPSQGIEAILLSLSPITPTARTLPQAELLHQSFVAHLARGDRATTGLELIGKDTTGEPLRDHRHAHILPLDLDLDGHLDHALVWAPAGLGPGAQDAVRSVQQTWQKGGGAPIRVAVAASGTLADLATLPPPWGANLAHVLGPNRAWRSLTPFVCPRHPKLRGRNTLEGQVQAELAARGLPAAETVSGYVGDDPDWPRLRRYIRQRNRGGAAFTGVWTGLTLTFAEPVAGPLCLGYASHFGLGLFTAPVFR